MLKHTVKRLNSMITDFSSRKVSVSKRLLSATVKPHCLTHACLYVFVTPYNGSSHRRTTFLYPRRVCSCMTLQIHIPEDPNFITSLKILQNFTVLLLCACMCLLLLIMEVEISGPHFSTPHAFRAGLLYAL